MKKIVRYLTNAFCIYKLYLYEIDLSKESLPDISSDMDYTFKRIDNDNYSLISTISDELESNVKKLLSFNDYGIFICVDGKPIGYGWLKQEGSKDAFFAFKNAAYLCRFFIHPDYRGKNLYPITIRYLISEFKDKYSKFHIAIEHKNIASIKGASKLRFKLVGNFSFIRILRCTLNKHKIINL